MKVIDINKLDKKINISAGKPMPMGVSVNLGGVNFALAGDKTKKYELVLFEKGTTNIMSKIEFTEDMLYGNVFAMCISNMSPSEFDYGFLENDKLYEDEYAKVINGKENWSEKSDITYSVYENGYDWENTRPLNISLDETIIYKLHVRGFTMNKMSKVKDKGTFLGVVEKIPYLKELGINAVLLMPSYEFNEIKYKSKVSNVIGMPANMEVTENIGAYETGNEINFWGYTAGNYLAPKSAYCTGKMSVADEFKTMVKEFHKNGTQVFMEFYFAGGTSPYLIVDCLRHWVMEYKIDGVSVNFDVAPINMIKNDPILSGIKIIGDNWNIINDYAEKNGNEKRYAVINDSFLITARKFLKSDEGQVYDMSCKIKECRGDAGIIHYIANHNTFSVMDMVSYERKHNEENGENNMDGTEYNFSWNCGVEGVTKKRKVIELRRKQMKNAFAFLLLSQGTPMIYAGDEMGHTTKGNNNPYCQDNAISYINWNDLKANADLFEFVKMLIDFRKNHKMLMMSNEPRMIDYKGLGNPDLSLHGQLPWKPDYNYVSRCFAFMYNEDYVGEGKMYVVFNMYWEDAEFNLPVTKNDKKWKLAFSTDTATFTDTRTVLVKERTVAVFIED
ncbi:MAG: alpha-amylase [Lachnospiraceae bacterium]|nr:alpha-amylase [Lachnospiraceae bacterium]